jgi:N4-(beta-N-acetylglucosaminyl)-L-asparaginase
VGNKLNRRAFVTSGVAAGVLAAARGETAQGPTVLVPKTVRPVVVASANGHKYRNGGPRTAVEEAFARMQAGEDVLDALVAGVNIVELDPEDDSVGYGGLPNAHGVVQLDACCMHGPRRRRAGWRHSRVCAPRPRWRGRS